MKVTEELVKNIRLVAMVGALTFVVLGLTSGKPLLFATGIGWAIIYRALRDYKPWLVKAEDIEPSNTKFQPAAWGFPPKNKGGYIPPLKT